MEDPLAYAPIGQLIGLEIKPPEIEGQADVYLEVLEHHHNPMGLVHGGVLSLLADAAMGIAFGRTLANPKAFATIELKMNFIRPFKRGKLRATACMVERGLRLGFVECRITSVRGKLIATGTCTCSIV